MECTQSINAKPFSNQERRQSLRPFKVIDLSFKQFLKYLEVLKGGEAALRYEIEKDEELAQRKSSRSRLSLGPQGTKPSLSTTSNRRRNSAQCNHKNSSPSGGNDKLSASWSESVLRADVLLNTRRLSTKDYDKPTGVSANPGENSKDLNTRTLCSSEIPNYASTRRNSHRTDLLNAPSDNYFWTTSVQTSDLRRHSSGSTDSVFLQESPRQPTISRDTRDCVPRKTTGHFPTGFRLPQITFSSGDNDVFFSPVEKTFVKKQSQKEARRLSTSHSGFPSKATPGNTRGSQSARQQKVGTVNRENDSFRNSNQSHNGYSVVREVNLPCACECIICDHEYSAGPIRVLYSSTGPLRKPCHLDGFPDGHGKPGWLASRKNEVQGLVFNRQTHSFHPPLLRKWNQ